MTQAHAAMILEAYRPLAIEVLAKAGIQILALAAEEWLHTQWEIGTSIDKLPEAWAAPDNTALAQEIKALQRMEYVTDELRRKLARATERRDELAAKLKASDLEKVVDLAADNVEHLINCSTQIRVYSKYMKAIAARESVGLTGADYTQLSMYAYREVAVGASHQTRSSSWQSNVTKEAELAAAGEVASLFVDLARL